jgi:hypothetical protein
MDKLIKFKVTCRVDDCGNGNITIPVLCVDETPNVVCGVCSETITDVQAIK